ncbi:MAG: hypothetical protein IPM47_02945 [Sphingobacteriales bacterium]|nr:MAG: hypothetical protein IPM47_02945 [Sphingobacteriales bacterium]
MELQFDSLKYQDVDKIKTSIVEYEPDFGLMLKCKSMKTGSESEYYFVIETKGTNDINDKR